MPSGRPQNEAENIEEQNLSAGNRLGVKARHRGAPGQAGIALEAQRASVVAKALAEVQAHRLAREVPKGAAAAAAHASLSLVGSGRAGADTPAVRAIRTDATWMAQSATFRDSDALKWPTETPGKWEPSQRLAGAGAASVATSPRGTPTVLVRGRHHKPQWPGPAGWWS
mmetsp:Transcript_83981/g.195345  ORF Transcript_83981/g.195345 Transcript_83981/m.195345 type:complete len:169 (+) Transcript_83981:99-605(+)